MNAWNTIGEVLGTEGNACEQRFNVLRAKYNVERKKMSSLPSGSGSSKDWELFKLLSFLDSHIVTRKTKGNVISADLSSPSTSSASSVWSVISITMTADDVAVETVAQKDVPENEVVLDKGERKLKKKYKARYVGSFNQYLGKS
ncbi:hypothetical protein RN001_005941 [Aquatica leii]|uniref:MADF domain-containing protein n=1 Tax=Aquatica leii TaxID=1421715 RepID=A0AAN7Q205_9COLE|nr:hypothetical protein RN001_005941 [Aquatica leii]